VPVGRGAGVCRRGCAFVVAAGRRGLGPWRNWRCFPPQRSEAGVAISHVTYRVGRSHARRSAHATVRAGEGLRDPRGG